MYQFSRAIYRELAPQILPPPAGAPPASNHADVLHACEEVVKRLATDRHSFARPARALFLDIRNYFPMSSQAHVHRVVDLYMGYALQFLAEHPHEAQSPESLELPGARRTASARSGA